MIMNEDPYNGDTDDSSFVEEIENPNMDEDDEVISIGSEETMDEEDALTYASDEQEEAIKEEKITKKKEHLDKKPLVEDWEGEMDDFVERVGADYADDRGYHDVATALRDDADDPPKSMSDIVVEVASGQTTFKAEAQKNWAKNKRKFAKEFREVKSLVKEEWDEAVYSGPKSGGRPQRLKQGSTKNPEKTVVKKSYNRKQVDGGSDRPATLRANERNFARPIKRVHTERGKYAKSGGRKLRSRRY